MRSKNGWECKSSERTKKARNKNECTTGRWKPIYVHSEVEICPMMHDKDNSIDQAMGINENLTFPPNKVVYKQTTE